MTANIKNSPLPDAGEGDPRPSGGLGEGGKVVAFVGLGSNLGDRVMQITLAVEKLNQFPGVRLVGVSSYSETKPLGPPNQPDYVNAVVCIETSLRPLELLDALQSIEISMGRERTIRWGPRIIDLDILLYGDQTINEPRLKVPHPELKNRIFIQTAIDELRSEKTAPSPYPLPQGEGGRGDVFRILNG